MYHRFSLLWASDCGWTLVWISLLKVLLRHDEHSEVGVPFKKQMLKFYPVKMLLYIFMRHVEHTVRLGLGSHLKKKILKFYSVMFNKFTLHFQ